VEEAHPGWASQVGARPPTKGARPVRFSSYKRPPPAPLLFTQTLQKTTQISVSREGALVVKRRKYRERGEWKRKLEIF